MHAQSEEGGIDWRRLASDRNVSHTVARALWERARATAPDDPVQAGRAFHRMLEDAAAANATHEPGRETLVDATPGARDAASLGPGKWTRVLIEDPKPGGPAGSAKRGTQNAAQAPAERGTGNAAQASAAGGAETGKHPSAEELRGKLAAAAQASKNAAELLAGSDPATIVEALRELRDSEGPGVLQKIMNLAGGAIERILGQRLPDPHTQAGPVGERVQFSVGDEVHTQYVDDDGVPMMASTPKPVTAKVEEWRTHAAQQPPAVQQRVAPALARATDLGATATAQAKKAKAGDPAAKAALPATQQALGGSLATISRQIGAEPAARPKPAPATLPAPAAHGAPDAAAANHTPATSTPAAHTPTTHTPAPPASNPTSATKPAASASAASAPAAPAPAAHAAPAPAAPAAQPAPAAHAAPAPAPAAPASTAHPEPGNDQKEPEVPKSLVVPATTSIEQLSPAVTTAVEHAPHGVTRLYQASDTDPRSVTNNLLAAHKDAHIDKASAQLTLSPIQPAGLAHAQTLPELGAILGHQTGVSAVELQRNGEDHAEIVGSINPRATFAQLALNKRLFDAKKYYAVGTPNEAFAIDDITIAGVTVQGLKTTIGLAATQARNYLDAWVTAGKVREITSPVPPTKVYAFKPSPTPDDLLVPRNHPEYGAFLAGCASIPIPVAAAEHNWDLLIVGLRDHKPANFETVAANLMSAMSIAPHKGALWSGGEDLSDYAKTQGCATLEQQDFYKATKGLELVNDWPVARNAWAAFSRLYASQLRGKTHIFARRVAAGSVLVDIELKKIDELLSAPGGVPGGIDLRYHAMDWGDDPHQKLSAPLPGYWRELDAAGTPLAAGAVLEHGQPAATHATSVAEARFKAANAAKP